MAEQETARQLMSKASKKLSEAVQGKGNNLQGAKVAQAMLSVIKIPYENRLIEISRESYDILVWERCPIHVQNSVLFCFFVIFF